MLAHCFEEILFTQHTSINLYLLYTFLTQIEVHVVIFMCSVYHFYLNQAYIIILAAVCMDESAQLFLPLVLYPELDC